MALTLSQLTALKAAILAETDPAFVALRQAGAVGAMADFFNEPSTFVVFRPSVQTMEVGKAVNYDAVGAMTSANTSRISLFYAMNPSSFRPSADVRTFFDATFSGALAGAGQATRDALTALWKRLATRGERVFATGTGSDASPGALVFEGSISINDVVQAVNLP